MIFGLGEAPFTRRVLLTYMIRRMSKTDLTSVPCLRSLAVCLLPGSGRPSWRSAHRLAGGCEGDQSASVSSGVTDSLHEGALKGHGVVDPKDTVVRNSGEGDGLSAPVAREAERSMLADDEIEVAAGLWVNPFPCERRTSHWTCWSAVASPNRWVPHSVAAAPAAARGVGIEPEGPRLALVEGVQEGSIRAGLRGICRGPACLLDDVVEIWCSRAHDVKDDAVVSLSVEPPQGAPVRLRMLFVSGKGGEDRSMEDLG
jgi:hypothetical protein